MKKEMSAKVFRYIVEADEEELKVMKILIDCCVMSCWCEWLNAYTKVKLDDVGDATCMLWMRCYVAAPMLSSWFQWCRHTHPFKGPFPGLPR